MARSRRASPNVRRFSSSSPSPPLRAATPTQTGRPEVTNIYVQRPGMATAAGGGMAGGGSGMLGTMAAVAGGSVLGHGLSHYLYSNNNNNNQNNNNENNNNNQNYNQQPPAAEAQTLATVAAQENNVCAPQLGGYAKCVEQNAASLDQCKWAWDYFLQCRDGNAASAPGN